MRVSFPSASLAPTQRLPAGPRTNNFFLLLARRPPVVSQTIRGPSLFRAARPVASTSRFKASPRRKDGGPHQATLHNTSRWPAGSLRAGHVVEEEVCRDGPVRSDRLVE